MSRSRRVVAPRKEFQNFLNNQQELLRMAPYRVSKLVNNSKHGGPECLQ